MLAQGLVIVSALLGADSSGHGEEGKPYDHREFSPEQKERIADLFSHIICKCPNENWTKTLAECPDGCADHQKAEVRSAVKAGRSNEEVLAEQVRRCGERVLSVPDSSLPTLVPYLALGLLGLVVGVLLFKAVRPAAGAPAGGPSGGKSAGARKAPPRSEEDRRLDEAVEKDLAEMEE